VRKHNRHYRIVSEVPAVGNVVDRHSNAHKYNPT